MHWYLFCYLRIPQDVMQEIRYAGAMDIGEESVWCFFVDGSIEYSVIVLVHVPLWINQCRIYIIYLFIYLFIYADDQIE